MDLALAWLEGVKQRRFFAWVHLYDPHTPYEPPEPFISRYPGQPYLGRDRLHRPGRRPARRAGSRRTGSGRSTILVLLADHGESLGEHGERPTPSSSTTRRVHVPLIVRTPWGDRGRTAAQVSTVDVMPTVLDLARPRAPAGHRRPLARAARARTRAPSRRASRTPRPTSRASTTAGSTCARCATAAGSTSTLRRRSCTTCAPTPARRRTSSRPTRAAPRTCASPSRSSRAAATRRRPTRRALDPETLQRLSALGYVGGGPRVDPQAVLPDPKDKIGLFGRIGKARALAKQEKLDEAVAAMRLVIAEDPKIIDAHTSARRLAAPAETLGRGRRRPTARRSSSTRRTRSRSRRSPRRTARRAVPRRRSRATARC